MSLSPVDPRLPGEDPPLTHKVCTNCRCRRHVTDFPRNRHTKDGLSSWCRWCHREVTKNWRQRNVEHIRAYRQRRKAA